MEKKNKESSKKSGASANKRSRRSETQSISLGEQKCLFCMKADDECNLCAGGTQHATAGSVNEEKNRSFSENFGKELLSLRTVESLPFCLLDLPQHDN